MSDINTLELKTCSKCGLPKPPDDFYRKKNGRSSVCKVCEKQYQELHYQEKRDAKLSQKREYDQANKTVKLAYNRSHRKERRKNDPIYSVRADCSTMIYRSLKKRGATKSSSILEKLPYSMEELRKHLEQQFEPWMTWNNRGKYDAQTWDDDNSVTWSWQLDHIIPQSDLPYTSMEDDNFQKCWALSNLRPLSAKQNWLDGITKTRHLPR